MMRNALARWLRPQARPDGDRWVVLDVESSGLDIRRDRLLAIAAIAVRVGVERVWVELGDSFEVVLRQAPATTAAPDKANILLHGIGVGAQRDGVDAAAALRSFEAFVGDAPLVAFHAAFDRAMIERACHTRLGQRPSHRWLDLEPLAAVLHPKVPARSLDEWMAHFGVVCAVRHQAAADTLATAELLQKLWPAFRAQAPKAGFRDAVRLAAQRRWVSG
jgi:DNA polymerase III subunit epsilon